jgi:hypothetical protein
MDQLLFAVIGTGIDTWTFVVALSQHRSNKHPTKKWDFTLVLKILRVILRMLKCYLIFQGGGFIWMADILLIGTSIYILAVDARNRNKAPTS